MQATPADQSSQTPQVVLGADGWVDPNTGMPAASYASQVFLSNMYAGLQSQQQTKQPPFKQTSVNVPPIKQQIHRPQAQQQMMTMQNQNQGTAKQPPTKKQKFMKGITQFVSGSDNQVHLGSPLANPQHEQQQLMNQMLHVPPSQPPQTQTQPQHQHQSQHQHQHQSQSQPQHQNQHPQHQQQQSLTRSKRGHIPPPGKFYCELCQCHCNDQQAFNLHLQGKKHQHSLRKRRVPSDETYPEQDASPSSPKNPFAVPLGGIPPHLYLSPEDSLINTRNNELSPTGSQALALANLVQLAVDSIGILPSVADVKLVGSYAKGTMLRSNPVADLVAVMKDGMIPTIETVSNMCKNISEKLPSATTTADNCHITFIDTVAHVTVIVTVTWSGAWDVAYEDPTSAKMTDIDVSECKKALASIRHAQWFLEHGMPAHSRPIIRIIKHHRTTNPAWQALNSWALDILVERALFLSNGNHLGSSRGLRCLFEFISSGVLLPGGYGLLDPLMNPIDLSKIRDDKEKEVEWRKFDITSTLTAKQRDEITADAQLILREIAVGKWDGILSPSTFSPSVPASTPLLPSSTNVNS